MSRVFNRAVVELKRVTRRPFTATLSPFRDDARPLIIHCCYHKVGTVWFLRILREAAAHFGMSFDTGSDYRSIVNFEQARGSDVFLDLGSHVRLDKLGPYVGSHMIRDPRDMIVSAYFYHLWTSEPWANLPMAEHRGMSYREYLNSLDREHGILAEMRRMSFWISHMAAWDYNNPCMFEIRYEDIMRDEPAVFRAMFTHYGFSSEAIEKSCEIAAKYTFTRMARKGAQTHLRSGKIGEWEEHFTSEHRQLFKSLYPGAVVQLGYESSDDW